MMKMIEGIVNWLRNWLKDWIAFLDKELLTSTKDDTNVVDRISGLPDTTTKDDTNVADRISGLPDDILISIISRLRLPEATATSVLSTRWRYLYTFIDRLIFASDSDSDSDSDKERDISDHVFSYKEHKKWVSNYLNMFSHTMDSHKGGEVLKEVRMKVRSCLGANAERYLEFALVGRKVEKIVLYIISVRNLNLVRMIGCGSLPCLKELSLIGADVDDDEVEFLVANSPLLESLSISYSSRLRNVSIIGHSVGKLKQLEICDARFVNSIKILDMINLVSFRCYGLRYRYVLQLSNVPKLRELGLCQVWRCTLTHILPTIHHSVLHQLQILKVRTPNSVLRYYLPHLPDLINVKHLEVEFHEYGSGLNCQVFDLIEACTSLEKLEIKFKRVSIEVVSFAERRIFLATPRRALSPNIKTMKLSGYIGELKESEIALFVVRNVAAFQELVIKLCDKTPEIRRKARRCAQKHFRRRIPKSVNVVFI